MRRAAVAVLCAALLLGAKCGGGGGSGTTLSFTPGPVTVAPGLFSVDLALVGSFPLQAIDLDLVADAPGLVVVDVRPHPEFDDDGALFAGPEIDLAQGTATGVVDLRHGAAKTAAKLFTVDLQAVSPGSYQLAVSAVTLARPDGSTFNATLTPLQVTVTP